MPTPEPDITEPITSAPATFIDEATRRRLAVEIGADPRSIARALRGEYVRGLAGHRIRAGLAERGLIAADAPAAQLRRRVVQNEGRA
jgi:hypothetical protein